MSCSPQYTEIHHFSLGAFFSPEFPADFLGTQTNVLPLKPIYLSLKIFRQNLLEIIDYRKQDFNYLSVPYGKNRRTDY